MMMMMMMIEGAESKAVSIRDAKNNKDSYVQALVSGVWQVAESVNHIAIA